MNFYTQEKIIKNKLGLYNLAKELGNVSRACKVFGYRRDSFYRFKKLYESMMKRVFKRLVEKDQI